MNDQLSLFGARDLTPIQPAPHPPGIEALGRRLPENLFLGTSSWAFPGWRGIVYRSDANHTLKSYRTLLSRHGLLAYGQHPLLRSVGIDRTYYGPMPSSEFANYAELVPDGFRFLVKAHELVTRAEILESATSRPVANEFFLSADYARREIIEPALEGLADKCGVILFQFPPQSPRALGERGVFIERLTRFLGELPQGPHYAVELRNVELFESRYARALSDTGASHCYNVHPKMPTIADQLQETGTPATDTLVVRWMLRRDRSYEEAKEAFQPFERIAIEDAPARAAIAEACRSAVTSGQRAFVIVNNKAEGCAPLSLVKLAEEILT